MDYFLIRLFFPLPFSRLEALYMKSNNFYKKLTVEIPMSLFIELDEYCHYPNSLDLPKFYKYKDVIRFALEDYLLKHIADRC